MTNPRREEPVSVTVAHVVVTRQGRAGIEVLLLLRRNTGRADGTWDCPAGRIEPGESVIDAACRELDEEVGLQVKPSGLRLQHSEVVSVDGDFVQHAFVLADHWTGSPTNREPRLAEELLWAPADALPTPMLEVVVSGLYNTLAQT